MEHRPAALHFRCCQLVQHLGALQLHFIASRCDVEVAALQQLVDSGPQRGDQRLMLNQVAMSGLQHLRQTTEQLTVTRSHVKQSTVRQRRGLESVCGCTALVGVEWLLSPPSAA